MMINEQKHETILIDEKIYDFNYCETSVPYFN